MCSALLAVDREWLQIEPLHELALVYRVFPECKLDLNSIEIESVEGRSARRRLASTSTAVLIQVIVL